MNNYLNQPPLLLPRHLDFFADSIIAEPKGNAWNAAEPIVNAEDLGSYSIVKCAVRNADRIPYCFRRSTCYREFEKKEITRKILRIIACRKNFLQNSQSL